MTKGCLYSCLCLFALVGAAHADVVSYSFQPNPADLSDLDHSYAYTWGLNWTLPEDTSLVRATLEIKNLRNWEVEPNILYIHLLDSAKLGVRSLSDNRSGDYFAGQGILLTTFTDTGTRNNHPAVNWSYEFSATDLATLTKYVTDSRFGLGFDPDCHYYNDGVKLTLFTDSTPTPEPATLAALGLGLPLYVCRRRGRARAV